MGVKTKKTPMRMCIGCRQMFEKRALVRVVRSEDGQAHIDLRGKMPGRGAYVCKNEECLNKAIKIKAIERALEVTLSAQTVKQLAEEIK